MSDLKQILKSKPLILLVLKEKGPLSGTEIAKITGLSINTVYYNIKELLGQGLVVKINDKYGITESGKEYLKQVEKAVKVVG